jgi:hypothetical protein
MMSNVGKEETVPVNAVLGGCEAGIYMKHVAVAIQKESFRSNWADSGF